MVLVRLIVELQEETILPKVASESSLDSSHVHIHAIREVHWCNGSLGGWPSCFDGVRSVAFQCLYRGTLRKAGGKRRDTFRRWRQLSGAKYNSAVEDL